MKIRKCSALLLLPLVFTACAGRIAEPDRALREQLEAMLSDAPAQVGVAIITPECDTIICGTDAADYPLMSVFKLHQAVAVAYHLDGELQPLDTVLTVDASTLNPDTWSPMLNDFPSEGDFTISVDRLLQYTLVQSDNNASNLLFDHVLSVRETDSIIRRIIHRDDFTLHHTEAEMQQEHTLCYDNVSSPLACAVLIHKVMTEPELLSTAKLSRLRQLLGRCRSATDRLAAPLDSMAGVTLAHRTGTGYTCHGDSVIMCVNDVGYVTLPSGRGYAIAVLIRDYHGTADSASALIARISHAALCNFAEM